MVQKQHGLTRLERKRALCFAKRAGLGITGALNGTFVAACLLSAGISFFDPLGTAGALTMFGCIGGFFGVALERPPSSQRAKRAYDGLEESDPSESLSGAGTFIANSAALIAGWLFLSNMPPATLGGIAIGFWWVFGVTLQIAAGALARLRAVDPSIV